MNNKSVLQLYFIVHWITLHCSEDMIIDAESNVNSNMGNLSNDFYVVILQLI